MTKRKGPAAALQRSPAQPPRARRSAHAQLQARCVDWFDTNYPSLRPLRHASAGGVYLGRARAAAAKREGIVNKGELDLAFSGRSKDERFIGLAIELKANAADRLTTEQKQTITVLLVPRHGPARCRRSRFEASRNSSRPSRSKYYGAPAVIDLNWQNF